MSGMPSDAVRFDFPEDSHTRETARREEVRRSVDRAWGDLQANRDKIAQYLEGSHGWDMPAFLSSVLEGIAPGLGWEFQPAEGGAHRLVLSTGGDPSRLPLVEEIVRRAPRLEGWDIRVGRPAASEEVARLLAGGRTGADPGHPRFEVALGEHHRVDVFWHADSPVPESSVLVFVAALLGEELLADWIGRVEKRRDGPVFRLGRRVRLLPEGITADRLKGAVDLKVMEISAALPAIPHWSPQPAAPASGSQAAGRVFSRNCPEAEDYPGWSDWMVASTAEPDLWMAWHEDQRFVSARYSRTGETFAYLKLGCGGRGNVAGRRPGARGVAVFAAHPLLVPKGKTDDMHP
ncbi:MAG: hypothetical protein RBU45_15125 [Myxococcota bacterium]|nr:hypothetical protein [Myxococcota bacterium]